MHFSDSVNGTGNAIRSFQSMWEVLTCLCWVKNHWNSIFGRRRWGTWKQTEKENHWKIPWAFVWIWSAICTLITRWNQLGCPQRWKPEKVVMSLLIQYWCIPLYFCLYITFSPLWIPQPHNTPLWHPMQHLWACAIAHSHCPALIGPITNCTIGLASCIECTCDLWTPLLHFPFLMGPRIVFWWYFPCFTLLICHHDIWQLCLVTQLAWMWADQS